MNIGQMAAILGYFFLLFGALGFVTNLTMAGAYVLGIFHVNAVHNIMHLATGAVFVWAGKKSECASLRTFQFFAVAYGVLTLLGNVFFNRLMIGPMAINQPDTLLHAMVAGFAFYCGFLSEFRQTVRCEA